MTLHEPHPNWRNASTSHHNPPVPSLDPSVPQAKSSTPQKPQLPSPIPPTTPSLTRESRHGNSQHTLRSVSGDSQVSKSARVTYPPSGRTTYPEAEQQARAILSQSVSSTTPDRGSLSPHPYSDMTLTLPSDLAVRAPLAAHKRVHQHASWSFEGGFNSKVSSIGWGRYCTECGHSSVLRDLEGGASCTNCGASYWEVPEHQEPDDVPGSLTFPSEWTRGHASMLKHAFPEQGGPAPREICPECGGDGCDYCDNSGRVDIPTGDYFHVAPTSERNRIKAHGIHPSNPYHNPSWKLDQWGAPEGYFEQRFPTGVYLWPRADRASAYAHGMEALRRTPHDVWRVPASEVQGVQPDPAGEDSMKGSLMTSQPIMNAELHEGPEHRTGSHNAAQETPCQTPGAIYDTKVGPQDVSIKVKLPFELDLTEDEAEMLEKNMHNVMEMTLAPQFKHRTRKHAAWGLNKDELHPEQQRVWDLKYPSREYDQGLGEFVRNPPPGTRLWRGEQRPIGFDPNEGMGMHWTVSPNAVITPSYPDEGQTPVVWQGTLGDNPEHQMFPRSDSALWGGKHRSMGWEGEVRLRPHTQFDTEGYWRPTRESPGSFYPYPTSEGKTPADRGWEFVPVGQRLPILNKGHLPYDDLERNINEIPGSDRLWDEHEKSQRPSDFQINYDQVPYVEQHAWEGNPWGIGYGGPRPWAQPPENPIDVSREFWGKTAQENTLWYNPGRHPWKDPYTRQWHQETGRGLLTPEGQMYTWPESEMTHNERALSIGQPMQARGGPTGFAIFPSGEVRTTWPGHMHNMADPAIEQEIAKYDPRLKARPVDPEVYKGTGFDQNGVAIHQGKWQFKHSIEIPFSYDPTRCVQCGGPMSEPSMVNGRYLNHCTQCHRTREVPSASPLLKQWQQNFPAYPEALQAVSPDRPWVYSGWTAGKIAPLAKGLSHRLSEDYRGLHQAPGPGDATTQMHDLSPLAPDIYEHPEYYHDMPRGTPENAFDQESWSQIASARANPEAAVTIHRAGPSNMINTGDWVTPSHGYAKQHASHPDDPAQDMPVWSASVPAKHLWWDGNSFNEFGYHGPPVEGSPKSVQSP